MAGKSRGFVHTLTRESGKKGARRVGIAGRVALCVVLFAALCVVPVFENSAIGYVPVLAFAVTVGLAFAYPRLLARHLEFDLLADRGECLRDADVKLLARFHNPLPLVCPRIDVQFRMTDIFGGDDVVSDFSFSLGARRTRDFPFGARFAHIGTVTAGIRRVVVHDPFGLFFRTVQVEGERSIDVLPHTFPLNADLLKELKLHEALEASTPFNKDGVEYTGVREYVYGDPMKSIHWKLSSHSDDSLYTRLFDAVGDPSAHILCCTEFGQHDAQVLMSLYDAEVETALSLFDYGMGASLRMSLSFADGKGSETTFDNARQVGHREFVQRFVRPQAEGSKGSGALPDLVERAAGATRDAGNLLVCTSVLDEALVEALTSVGRRHKRAMLFYFLPPGITDKERRGLSRPLHQLEQGGVACFALSSAAQLGGLAHA